MKLRCSFGCAVRDVAILQVVLTQPPKSNPIEVDVDLGAEAVTSFQKVRTLFSSPALSTLPEAFSYNANQVQAPQHLQSGAVRCRMCKQQQSRLGYESIRPYGR